MSVPISIDTLLCDRCKGTGTAIRPGPDRMFGGNAPDETYKCSGPRDRVKHVTVRVPGLTWSIDNDTLCDRCGHEISRHDPEDGYCDAYPGGEHCRIVWAKTYHLDPAKIEAAGLQLVCEGHDSFFTIGYRWDDVEGYPGVPMCDKVGLTTDDEGKICKPTLVRLGVIGEVVT